MLAGEADVAHRGEHLLLRLRGWRDAQAGLVDAFGGHVCHLRLLIIVAVKVHFALTAAFKRRIIVLVDAAHGLFLQLERPEVARDIILLLFVDFLDLIQFVLPYSFAQVILLRRLLCLLRVLVVGGRHFNGLLIRIDLTVRENVLLMQLKRLVLPLAHSAVLLALEEGRGVAH